MFWLLLGEKWQIYQKKNLQKQQRYPITVIDEMLQSQERYRMTNIKIDSEKRCMLKNALSSHEN